MSDLRDIVAAAICKYNVNVDIEGILQPQISTETCKEPCGYCHMAADYICKQIEEGNHDEQSASGFCGKARAS